jgi:hypothetical protein
VSDHLIAEAMSNIPCAEWAPELQRALADVRRLERENAALRADLLEAYEETARAECYTDLNVRTYQGVPEVNITDSGAMSRRAYVLRKLASAGRFRIVREFGRMVVGYWPENDPQKKEAKT